MTLSEEYIKQYLDQEEINNHISAIESKLSGKDMLYVCVAQDDDLLLQSVDITLGYRDRLKFYAIGTSLGISRQLLFGAYLVTFVDGKHYLSYLTLDDRQDMFCFDQGRLQCDTKKLPLLEILLHGFMDIYLENRR